MVLSLLVTDFFNALCYGGGGGGAPPPPSLKSGFFYTVGNRCTKTQNPKNEPASIKTLDLRVKNSFNLRVGNAIFARGR